MEGVPVGEGGSAACTSGTDSAEGHSYTVATGAYSHNFPERQKIW